MRLPFFIYRVEFSVDDSCVLELAAAYSAMNAHILIDMQNFKLQLPIYRHIE